MTWGKAGVYISTLFRNFGYWIVLEFCPFSEKFYVFSKIISEIQQLKKFSRSVLLDKLKKTRKRNQDFLILFGYLNNYPTQLYIVGVNTPWKPVKPFFLIDTAKYEKKWSLEKFPMFWACYGIVSIFSRNIYPESVKLVQNSSSLAYLY